MTELERVTEFIDNRMVDIAQIKILAQQADNKKDLKMLNLKTIQLKELKENLKAIYNN